MVLPHAVAKEKFKPCYNSGPDNKILNTPGVENFENMLNEHKISLKSKTIYLPSTSSLCYFLKIWIVFIYL
jgi:hypothetical protein